MKLTREEQEMLEGKKGPAVQKAMEMLVEYGEGFNAECMVDVNYVHADGGQVVFHKTVDHIEEYHSRGALARVPASTEVTAMDMSQWKEMGIPEDYAQRQKDVDKKLKEMNFACTYTCTPYLAGYIPPKGSHIASVESSNQTFMNSVLGVRSNRDGGQFTSLSAFTGKYPKFGYHLDENRKGTHLINVRAELKDSTDYGALGLHIGRYVVGSGVPVLKGIKNPTFEDLKALSALMAQGAVALYHIPGVTAEAQTLEEAFHGQIPKDEIVVTQKDIEAVYERLKTAKDPRVNIVDLGCPHYTLEEIRKVASLVRGRKKHTDVIFNVWTVRTVKILADSMGYTGAIEDFGGRIFTDSCITSCQWSPTSRPCSNITVPKRPNFGTFVTDSVKHGWGGPLQLECEGVVLKLEDCIKAAITGRWC